MSSRFGVLIESVARTSVLDCATCYSCRSYFGRHFQGVSYNATNPGLKPWAILYSRFAANSRHCVPGRLNLEDER